MIKAFAGVILLGERTDKFLSKTNEGCFLSIQKEKLKPKQKEGTNPLQRMIWNSESVGEAEMEGGKCAICSSLSILELLPGYCFCLTHHTEIQQHFSSSVRSFSRDAATEPFLCRAAYAIMCNVNREIKFRLPQIFFLSQLSCKPV